MLKKRVKTRCFWKKIAKNRKKVKTVEMKLGVEKSGCQTVETKRHFFLANCVPSRRKRYFFLLCWLKFGEAFFFINRVFSRSNLTSSVKNSAIFENWMNTGANRSVHSKNTMDFQGIPKIFVWIYGSSWPGPSKTQLFLRLLLDFCACAMFEAFFFKNRVFYASPASKIFRS